MARTMKAERVPRSSDDHLGRILQARRALATIEAELDTVKGNKKIAEANLRMSLLEADSYAIEQLGFPEFFVEPKE